jgi:hypothetical protein
MTLYEQIKAMEAMRRTAANIAPEESATYYAAAAAIAAAITIRAKEEPTPVPIENPPANSLTPHSVWAVWNEAGTDVLALALSEDDANRQAEAIDSGHVAEYFLALSKSIKPEK